MKDDECMLRVCFNGGLYLAFLVIAIFSFAIVFILTSRISLRLSSKLHQFNCCQQVEQKAVGRQRNLGLPLQ
jgi:hypothetical protein